MVLRISDVKKAFGKKQALLGISLTINPGMVLGLLGPNGAGKTTTLRTITGLIRPDEGTVHILGQRATPEAVQRHIGYLPDEPFLYPKLTGREFLVFLASVHQIPAPQAQVRINALTTDFDLTGHLDDLIESYSLGTKRKIALCGVLLHEPDLLILDEPLNGLDPKSVRKVKDLLHEYSRNGKAVLLSTHLLDIAQSLCTDVSIINKGALVLDERPMEHVSGSLEQLFLKITTG